MEADAPPPLRRRVLVMLAGLFTTVLTLSFIGSFDAYWLMAIYIFFLPVGALAIGMAAGSGYGLASWKFTDQKVSRSMLLAIVVSMIGLYLAIEIFSYWEHSLSFNSFFEYFDITTRGAAWETEWGRSEAAGAYGYGNRGLELVAVMLGGVAGCGIVPLTRAYLSTRGARF